MIRAAFTVWNDRIAPVFDVATQALLVVSENNAVSTRDMFTLSKSSALAKIASLADLQADVLICGAISRPARSAADTFGIEVHAFIAGSVSDVVQAWFEGRLGDSCFAMPGCGCKQACCRKRTWGAGGTGKAGSGFFD
jgi:predicted Fe-Mo cluster-binding NifX family protein